jgi:hypothetical protein
MLTSYFIFKKEINTMARFFFITKLVTPLSATSLLFVEPFIDQNAKSI